MASARPREGRFIGLYRDRFGKQKSAGTFKTEKQALNRAQACEAVEKSGRDARAVLDKPKVTKAYAPSRRGLLTVAGYAPTFLAGHRLERNSRDVYECIMEHHVIPHLGNKVLHELTASDVRIFFRNLERETSGATVRKVMTVLHEMFRTAVADGHMEHDPASGLKISAAQTREMRILTPDEYHRLHKVIDTRYKLFVKTAVSTGLRWGELIAINGTDVVQEGNRHFIRVRRTISETRGKTYEKSYGKTARAMRDVSIDAGLAADLAAAGRKSEYIFTAPMGGNLKRGNFRRTWHAAITAAKLPGLRVHDMRHTHASWLVNGGADLVTVRDRLGHSDIKVTSRYLHAVQGQEDKALSALSAALAA
jgi:integrase